MRSESAPNACSGQKRKRCNQAIRHTLAPVHKQQVRRQSCWCLQRRTAGCCVWCWNAHSVIALRGTKQFEIQCIAYSCSSPLETTKNAPETEGC
jgi:hypothetical protein